MKKLWLKWFPKNYQTFVTAHLHLLLHVISTSKTLCKLHCFIDFNEGVGRGSFETSVNILFQIGRNQIYDYFLQFNVKYKVV